MPTGEPVQPTTNRRITSMAEYLAVFNRCTPSSESPLIKAWEIAVDNRRIEIDLYWKRAAYFWTFIGVAFAGYFAMDRMPAGGTSDVHFAVACLGFLFSLGWYLAMRGAKFWHQNWERHVDVLEDAIVGPIHKMIVRFESCKRRRLADPYPFSMTKINAVLGVYAVLAWAFLALRIAARRLGVKEPFEHANIVLIGLMTIVFVVWMAKGVGAARTPWTIDFEIRSISTPLIEQPTAWPPCATSAHVAGVKGPGRGPCETK